jgi:hypothetical protein
MRLPIQSPSVVALSRGNRFIPVLRKYFTCIAWLKCSLLVKNTPKAPHKDESLVARLSV